ncbi:hypothetical protein EJ110_NYTH55594 [Nymphaea thermarum]|nr:hypothetical protein EJ110_NYTH55594 [Nymphaea thermarum]
MFCVSISSLPFRLLPCPWFSSFSSSSLSLTNSRLSTLSSHASGSRVPSSAVPLFSPLPFCFASRNRNLVTCRAAEYVFPDPIPEFAEAETERFRTHLLKTLSESDMYGESCEEVVGICTEIFNTFLNSEYGGPGTLLVIPFIDMADTLRERGLPGAGEAAEEAVEWAREHVDKDWEQWTGND